MNTKKTGWAILIFNNLMLIMLFRLILLFIFNFTLMKSVENNGINEIYNYMADKNFINNYYDMYIYMWIGKFIGLAIGLLITYIIMKATIKIRRGILINLIIDMIFIVFCEFYVISNVFYFLGDKLLENRINQMLFNIGILSLISIILYFLSARLVRYSKVDKTYFSHKPI